MRADGEKNKKALFDAAEELVSRRGTDVSVAEIVAAAGVAAPTLYRHFGTKNGLLDALAERQAYIAAGQLASAMAEPSGWRGLRVAIDNSLELARTNRALQERSGFPESVEQMLLAGWQSLIDRAHKEGSVRRDFSSTDLPFLLSAIAAIGRDTNFDKELQDRYVTLLMEGLRPDPLVPLPGRAPQAPFVRRMFSPGHTAV